MAPTHAELVASVILYGETVPAGAAERIVQQLIEPAIAAAEKRGGDRVRRQKSLGCGCGWCCASMPPGIEQRGQGHHGCQAARMDP